jgi:conjugative transfer signal peptidase TraF
VRLWHRLTRRPWIAPAGLVLLSLLHPAGLRVNFDSSSQPRGLYWLTAGAPRRDQLVLVRLPGQIARFGIERGYLRHPELAKCVAALPGDTVEITAVGLRVNGQLLPGTVPRFRDSKRRWIGRYPRGPHDTLPGWLWLDSDHIPHSWDSRYFGPIPQANVLGRLYPLLTWPPFPHNLDGESTCRWNPTNF